MRSTPRRYLLALFAVHACALVVAWTVGLWLWFSAGALVFGYLLTFVLPVSIAIFVTSFVVDPSRTSDALVTKETDISLERRVAMALGPFVLASLVTAPLLYLGWSQPRVRAAGIELSAKLGWVKPAENGLLGIAPEVRMAACRAGSRHDLSSRRLWTSISSSPSARVTDCLLEILPEGSGRSHDVRHLTRRWARELKAEGTSPDKACKTAHWIAQTDALGNDGAAAELLDCALSAPEVSTRVCCGRSLRALTRGAPIHSVLPGPGTFIESSVEERLRTWMRLGRPGALDPRVDEFLDWSSIENREAVGSLACGLIDRYEPAVEGLRVELQRVPQCQSLDIDRQLIREACDGEPDHVSGLCQRAAARLRRRAEDRAKGSVSFAARLAQMSMRPSVESADSRRSEGLAPRGDAQRLMLERMQLEHGEPVDFRSLDLLEFMKRQTRSN